jgi:hypothetical protein
MNDTQILATYWAEEYIQQANEQGWAMPPIVVACGGTADAVISNENGGADETTSTAHLIGIFTYPTDAIYITTAAMSLAVNVDDDDSPMENPATDPRCRVAVTAWAHSIVTSETTLCVMIREVTEDGVKWKRMMTSDDDIAEAGVFTAFRYAAHDFDRFAIADNEQDMRHQAMEEIEEANGGDYNVNFYSPGTVLTIARDHFSGID